MQRALVPQRRINEIPEGVCHATDKKIIFLRGLKNEGWVKEKSQNGKGEGGVCGKKIKMEKAKCFSNGCGGPTQSELIFFCHEEVICIRVNSGDDDETEMNILSKRWADRYSARKMVLVANKSYKLSAVLN